jgi:hypothetical protein
VPVVHASVQVVWQVPWSHAWPAAQAVAFIVTVQPELATMHSTGVSPEHVSPRPLPRYAASPYVKMPPSEPTSQ